MFRFPYLFLAHPENKSLSKVSHSNTYTEDLLFQIKIISNSTPRTRMNWNRASFLTRTALSRTMSRRCTTVSEGKLSLGQCLFRSTKTGAARERARGWCRI
ncbi:unnamed protein product [Amoebophrya sp. A120]|nr:unnamed protein product [Amoebophrya sp. A120]|eukprot:GSA120T00013449001.1